MKNKIIGIILGDPAGIGPEIVCKVLADNDWKGKFNPVIIGSEESFLNGMEVSKVKLEYRKVHSFSDLDTESNEIILFHKDDFIVTDLIPGEISLEIGKVTIRMIETAIDMVKADVIDAIVYAPINKNAINMADMSYSDELQIFKRIGGFDGLALEMNYSSNIWTTRVTGHIPLKKVSENLNSKKILDVIKLTNESLMKLGIKNPIHYVCALNPHGGEGGLFGDEEISIISPAVELATAEGISAQGPIPADVVFQKAFSGECDSVITMYHDQGQIALKTKAFGEGITYLVGLPFIAITVGHGVGYDIAFKGVAKVNSFQNAIEMTLSLINNSK